MGDVEGTDTNAPRDGGDDERRERRLLVRQGEALAGGGDVDLDQAVDRVLPRRGREHIQHRLPSPRVRHHPVPPRPRRPRGHRHPKPRHTAVAGSWRAYSVSARRGRLGTRNLAVALRESTRSQSVVGARAATTSRSVPEPARSPSEPATPRRARRDVFAHPPGLPTLQVVSLRVGVLSCVGQFKVGVLADPDAYADLDVYAAHVDDELRAAAVAARRASGRAPRHPEVGGIAPGRKARQVRGGRPGR